MSMAENGKITTILVTVSNKFNFPFNIEIFLVRGTMRL
jgi:hypothetical protein